ncbi:hypothetical protein IAU60_004727 [Kwoniella sp. DSM 27419]
MSAEEAAAPAADASVPDSPAAPAAENTSASPAAEAEPTKPAPASGKKAPASKAKGRASLPSAGKKGAASAAKEERTFAHGDIVLARLRGYPPWPARIANPDEIPRNVLAQRPGKSPYIFCCQFFPAGDYSWLQSKEIKPLTPSDITTYLSETHRKATGGLRVAYETAQDPTEWDQEQAEVHRANEEAENAVDELEDEDEEEEENAAGKRKRGAAAEKKGDKKKKAKTATKSKAEVDEIQSEEDAPKSKAKAKPAAKGKADKAKSAKAPVSKPEAQESAEDDPLASNPECVKVKDWRHKLQRAFLSKSLPSAEEMPTYDDLFKTIESYKDMTIDALQYSKIGKVMKKIVTLSEIPRNDEFKITDRASKLMHQWTDFIASSENKPNGNGDAAMNGTAADKDTEKAAEAAPDSEEKVDDAKADETVEEAEKKDEGEKMEVDA